MNNESYSITRQLSFRSQAVFKIRDAIVAGSLAPGSLHSEMTLAKTLEISRTPVREALLQLAQDGLVEFIPHRGVRITDFNRAYLANVFQLRTAVEGFCVDRLAENKKPEVMRALKSELVRQKKIIAAKAVHDWPQANVDFHLLIVKSSHNPLIEGVIQPLVAHTARFYKYTRKSNMRESYREHRAIVDAIEAGDRAAARNAVAEHLLQASSLMERLVRELAIEPAEKLARGK